MQLWQRQGVKKLSMSNIAVRWNALDSIIYKIESGAAKLADAVKESRDELPDPEEMIQAATKQLQIENELLKKREYPSILKYEDGSYYCPDCHELISRELIDQKKKYCPECGKRITLSTSYAYATSHKKLTIK